MQEFYNNLVCVCLSQKPAESISSEIDQLSGHMIRQWNVMQQ